MKDDQHRRTDGEISLVDSDITTAQVDRRSFLARAMAAGSLALGAVLSTGCGSDQCDNDIGRDTDDSGLDDTEIDDPPEVRGDPCDAD